jgi:glycosyltransferase involved in cell wall biosynthesis
VAARNDLISVIIPAFNAAATIDETLRSARGQTHADLEVIVVDDSSTDATPEIVGRHARADPRVQLVRQPVNGGPSAARNRAIELSKGAYIAPLDADDLWSADKLARQLDAFGDRGVGLVYSWYAIIDADSRIRFLDSRSEAEGDVVAALCERNFVGNGSAPLMTRAAVEEAGGYDEQLRGCEDYKLFFRIAERHRFALVRDFLVGYRERPDSLSSNFDLMLESHGLCEAEFGAGLPERVAALRRNRTRLMRFMASRCYRGGEWRGASRLLWRMVREDPLGVVANTAEIARKRFSRMKGTAGPGSELLGTRFRPAQPAA